MPEPCVDAPLVARLLETQFPQWAHLPLTQVTSAGTDNAMFRLGGGMCVRVPRVARAAAHVGKEQRWLPHLSGLPLAIPQPLGSGRPDETYPWHWSVYNWLPGETAALDRISDLPAAATTLARLVRALRGMDVSDAPVSGRQNEYRGVPLALRDTVTRRAIGTLADEIDAEKVTRIWDETLRLSVWSGAPVWIHGDIHAGNLLVRDGQISALIDFGLMGLGDPACDLMVGWNLLPAEARGVFRSGADIDEPTWLRGRGWALSVALVALAHYRALNPEISQMSRRTIREVLVDAGRGR